MGSELEYKLYELTGCETFNVIPQATSLDLNLFFSSFSKGRGLGLKCLVQTRFPIPNSGRACQKFPSCPARIPRKS